MTPTISIIDDDESVREATKSLVRSLGYAAATFSSAGEYLRSDSIWQSSCLITDLQMPEMSGVELQRRLTTDGNDTPIIFMTADFRRQDPLSGPERRSGCLPAQTLRC